jgi:hypothetical protein
VLGFRGLRCASPSYLYTTSRSPAARNPGIGTTFAHALKAEAICRNSMEQI